ncbi:MULTISPECIES: acetyl-CoA carboxylase carboxyltransferase subunit alpha [unclassified Nonomuraea]|uniref:acetyl-CoA carboxylase carboxyltransferase subunit alpha n=1 Tax=unclassified Nonomuraea TaxID=2593643 RepID=UPI0033C4C209
MVKGTWARCESCRTPVYDRRLARTLQVCPECGHHGRLDARHRLELLFDDGEWKELPAPPDADDPLDFTDIRPYRERLEQARESTGLDEAIVCATGTIMGRPLVAGAMDFRFLGGSLGGGVGERIERAARQALNDRIPLILISASGGARMQEGALALMQMVKTSQALTRLDEAGILTISLVTDPTYGGVAASFAALADVILAEPRARMGFAGPRVIEQTIGHRLPDGFQTAEFLLEHGLIDAIVPRAELREVIGRLLATADGERPPRVPCARVSRVMGRPDDADLWRAVQLARDPGRPTALDHVDAIVDGFQELRGDRASGDCPAIIGGVGDLAGRPIVVIGVQKGHDLRERIARNFGMPSPAGYRKARRLLRLAAKLRLPVLTLVDTPGAHPGQEAEERGQAFAIAENLRLMSGLPVPIVSVITGEGGSGGALALAVADRVLALENAVYSVISPEGCASILWRDPAAAPRAAAALQLGAHGLLRHRIVDAVIPEPPGGAHTDPQATSMAVKDAVAAHLDELAELEPAVLVEERRRRFSLYGGPGTGDFHD